MDRPHHLVLTAVVGAMFLLLRGTSMAQSPGNEAEVKLVAAAIIMLQTEDTFRVCAELEKDAEPMEAAGRYVALMNELYEKKRDIGLMVRIGRAGIHYCLREAARVESDNGELASKLRGTAKAMSYNIGSNTWPGWGEEGIVITASDQAAGADTARLNLRLAKELLRGPEPLGNAHWLLGAHALAAHQYPVAEEAFKSAAEEFQKCQKGDFVQMARGYAALTRKYQQPRDAAATNELQTILAELRKDTSGDGVFFADQIETAQRVLNPFLHSK